MKNYTLAVLWFIIGLAVLFIPVVAYGQSCRPGTVCATPTVQTYATPATQLLIPTYGVVYAPTYGGTTDETNRLLAELLAEQRALRAEVAALKAGGAMAAPKDPTPILKANCAKCHTSGALAPGTDFAMFDEHGDLYAMSSIDRKECAKRLRSGTMPQPVTIEGGLKVQKMPALERAELAQLLLNPPSPPKVDPKPPTIPPAVPTGASLKEPAVPKVGPADKK